MSQEEIPELKPMRPIQGWQNITLEWERRFQEHLLQQQREGTNIRPRIEDDGEDVPDEYLVKYFFRQFLSQPRCHVGAYAKRQQILSFLFKFPVTKQ